MSGYVFLFCSLCVLSMGILHGLWKGNDKGGFVLDGDFDRLRRDVGTWSRLWYDDVSWVVSMCCEIGRIVGEYGEYLTRVDGVEGLKELRRMLERIDQELSNRVRYTYTDEIMGGGRSIGYYVGMNMEIVSCELKRRELGGRF